MRKSLNHRYISAAISKGTICLQLCHSVILICFYSMSIGLLRESSPVSWEYHTLKTKSVKSLLSTQALFLFILFLMWHMFPSNSWKLIRKNKPCFLMFNSSKWKYQCISGVCLKQFLFFQPFKFDVCLTTTDPHLSKFPVPCPSAISHKSASLKAKYTATKRVQVCQKLLKPLCMNRAFNPLGTQCASVQDLNPTIPRKYQILPCFLHEILQWDDTSSFECAILL